jgi:hypothetical protein
VNGQEFVSVYFSDPMSETSINPQDNSPWWTAALIVLLVSLPLRYLGVLYIKRGFRTRTERKPVQGT